MRILKQIFSLTNANLHKIITICGFKIKIKSPKLEIRQLRKQYNLLYKDLKTEKKLHKSNIKKLKTMIETLESENKSLASSITQLSKDIDNYQASNKQLKKDFNQNLKELASQVESLQFINNIVYNPSNLPIATGDIRKHQLRMVDFAQKLIPPLENIGLHPMLTGGCLLGAVRNGHFIPWDDDLDFDLIREEFDKLIEYAKENYTYIESDKCKNYNEFLEVLDKTLQEKPNQIIFGRKPTCITAYFGTSLENFVLIDFFSRDFINPNMTEEKYLVYRESLIEKIQSFECWADYYKFFESELKNSEIYQTNSSMSAIGWDSYVFIRKGKAGFVPTEDIFPYQKINFENQLYYTYSNPDKFLKSLYGDYNTIPKNILPIKSITFFYEYLKKQNRNYYIDITYLKNNSFYK